jgi:predicted nucleic-acid-binding Zn-ribbon protein
LSEVKKCPKCGGDMEIGILTGSPFWHDGTNKFAFSGERIFGYKCKQCGYTELWGEVKGVKP